jgi:hypothetical protein
MAEEQTKCGQCALRSPDNQTCKLHGTPIRSFQNSCPEGVKQLEHCDLCGAEIFPKGMIISYVNGKVHTICQNCNNLWNTCQTCGQRHICSFETSPIDLPKQIQQQYQTAQGYVVTTIRNPERIRETCEKGCSCFDKEFGCSRESNYCSLYSAPW